MVIISNRQECAFEEYSDWATGIRGLLHPALDFEQETFAAEEDGGESNVNSDSAARREEAHHSWHDKWEAWGVRGASSHFTRMACFLRTLLYAPTPHSLHTIRQDWHAYENLGCDIPMSPGDILFFREDVWHRTQDMTLDRTGLIVDILRYPLIIDPDIVKGL